MRGKCFSRCAIYVVIAGARMEREQFVLLPISVFSFNSWETIFKTIHISQLLHKCSVGKVLRVVQKS
jgi:hypothetical protein